MKISNGNILEFLFAIFFINVGLNMSNVLEGLIIIIISVIVVIHCLYIWIFKKRKKNLKFENNNINNSTGVDKVKLSPKKSYIILTSVSLVLNIMLIFGVAILLSSKNDILKQKNEYKMCFEKIRFNTIATIETISDPTTGELVPKVDKMEYLLNEKKWKSLKECTKKYNINISIEE